MEAPFTRLTPLVEALGQAIHPYLTIPFAFVGHSMGALISFELARYLRRQHCPTPAHLFVSAHRAPQLARRKPPIHGLPDLEFMQKLRSLNGTPKAVLQNDELMKLMLPTLRADFAVCETYIYSAEAPLACPISAFGGWQDSDISYDDMAAWRNQTQNAFTLRMLPGDHFFLHSLREPLLQAIFQDLTQILSGFAYKGRVADV